MRRVSERQRADDWTMTLDSRHPLSMNVPARDPRVLLVPGLGSLSSFEENLNLLRNGRARIASQAERALPTCVNWHEVCDDTRCATSTHRTLVEVKRAVRDGLVRDAHWCIIQYLRSMGASM